MLIVSPSIPVCEVLAPEAEGAIVDITEGHVVAIGSIFFSLSSNAAERNR